MKNDKKKTPLKKGVSSTNDNKKIAQPKPEVKPKEEVELILVNDKHFYKVGEEYYPSVTTILQALAKGIGFNKYMFSKTEVEAKQELEEAGLAGSKIHNAIEQLIAGRQFNYQDIEYVDDKGMAHRGLTPEEANKLKTFIRWWHEYQPRVFASEKIVYSKTHKYAGTMDFIGTIKEGKIDKKSKTPDKDLWFIIDWKTSGGIYPSYEMQVTSYAQAEMEMTEKKIDKVAILRIGTRHKAGYEFKILDNISGPYRAFLGVLNAWRYENPKFAPRIVEIPKTFKLPTIQKVEVKEINKRQKNANKEHKQSEETPKTGDDQTGDEKRTGISESAGSLPLPTGSSGKVRGKTKTTGHSISDRRK